MSKKLLREYYALCDGGVCQDLLTEEEKEKEGKRRGGEGGERAGEGARDISILIEEPPAREPNR